MQYSKQGQLFTEIVLELFKLSGRLITEGDALTKPFGLTSARWKVLSALAFSSTPMTVSEIAHSMGQARQSVQRLADLLVKDGLLLYSPNPRHKRARHVSLSSRGRAVVQALEAEQIPWANKNSGPFRVADMEATLAILKQMSAQFE